MTEFRFLSRMENPPEQHTQIFRLRQPEVTEESVLKMAQRFELEGNLLRGVLQKDTSKITYTEGQMSVTLYLASGGLRYRNIARWQVDDRVFNVDMTDEEAIEIAQRYIRRFELVSQGEYKLLELTHLRVGVVERDTGYSEERIIDVGLAFQRIIDGVPVEGTGGKLILYIDHAGELTGVDRIWREIERVHRPSEQLQLRLPQLVEEDLMVHYRKPGRGIIEVGEFSFGYFELGWEDEQQYLQPAYVIPLMLISPNDRFRTGTEYVVPATVNAFEYGRLMPLSMRRLEQPSRQG